MAITVDFDENRVRQFIRELDFPADSLRNIFKDVAFLVENDVKDIIGNRKVDSLGRPWEDWSGRYQRRQARRGRSQPGNTLLDTGRLRSSIASDFDSEEMNVGSNLEYAQTQNDGDTRRNIPAREYLYIADSLTEDILDIVEREIDRVAGRI